MNSGSRPSFAETHPFRVIFADGAAFRLGRLRPIESVLHPIVLKYIIICLLIYVLLQRRPHLETMEWWFEAMLWLSIMFTTIGWLILSLAVARWLLDRKSISLVYTPMISIPLVLWNEAMGQLLISAATGQPVAPLSEIGPFLMRDILVMLLLDIQFGTFIAPLHPLFRKTDLAADADGLSPMAELERPLITAPPLPPVASTPAEEPPPAPAVLPLRGLHPQPPEDMPAPEDGPPTSGPHPTSIELDGRIVMLSEVMLVTAEDHYVRVQTVDRQFLVRGKFSAFVLTLGEGLGIQVSRSAWISAAFITAAYRTPDYRVVLITTDRQEIEAARSRRSEVLDFVRLNNIEISRSGQFPSLASG